MVRVKWLEIVRIPIANPVDTDIRPRISRDRVVGWEHVALIKSIPSNRWDENGITRFSILDKRGAR